MSAATFDPIRPAGTETMVGRADWCRLRDLRNRPGRAVSVAAAGQLHCRSTSGAATRLLPRPAELKQL